MSSHSVTTLKAKHSDGLQGTAFVLIAEALALPTGLVTSVFLTRSLGPTDYGLLTLAGSLILWIQGSISALFARAAVKLIAESETWDLPAAAVIRLHAVISGTLALVLVLFAAPISGAFKEPELVPFIRLYAVDIVLFSVSHAKRLALIGTGRYKIRAVAGASRWIARMVFVVLFVQMGYGISGAIMGSIVASAVELAIGHRYVNPPFFRFRALPWRRLLTAAAPLSIAAVGLRLFERVDLMLLKVLGGTAAQTGMYGAAQNITSIPTLLALACTPLLLSTLARALRDSDETRAYDAARVTMRLLVAIVPFVALASGVADDAVSLLFGDKYAGAGPILAILAWSSYFLMFLFVATIIPVAAGKLSIVPKVTLPLLPAAALCHYALIPTFGPIGAAWGSTIAASIGAIVSYAVVWRLWHITIPVSASIRSATVSMGIFALARLWRTSGVAVILEAGVLSLLIVIAMIATGENLGMRTSIWIWIRGALLKTNHA